MPIPARFTPVSRLNSRDSRCIKEQPRTDPFNRFEETIGHEMFDQAEMDLGGGELFQYAAS